MLAPGKSMQADLHAPHDDCHRTIQEGKQQKPEKQHTNTQAPKTTRKTSMAGGQLISSQASETHKKR